MNFENLKGILGEAYHDGLTAEEVNNFFANKNFADLSTGQYVDKNKYDRDIQSLNTTITEKQNALNAKMTDDERATQEREQDKQEIKRLTDLLKQNTISSNKSLAISNTSNIKSVLGLKDDDAEYNKFIDSIVFDDTAKTSSITKYITKIANDMYTKGKEDALKDSMGKFGNTERQNGDNASNEIGELGKELAKLNAHKKETIDYFKRNK